MALPPTLPQASTQVNPSYRHLAATTGVPTTAVPAQRAPSAMPAVPIPVTRDALDSVEAVILAVLPEEVWEEIKAFVEGKRSGQVILDFKTGAVQSYKLYKVMMPARAGARSATT